MSGLTAALFKKRLAQHNVTFENPSIEALRAIKDEVDQELHLEELPAELRGVHDQVCTLLLSKADGELPHRGATSVVGSGRPQSKSPPRSASSSQPLDQLRAAFASYLREFASAADDGDDVGTLRSRLPVVEQLLTTMLTIERAA